MAHYLHTAADHRTEAVHQVRRHTEGCNHLKEEEGMTADGHQRVEGRSLVCVVSTGSKLHGHLLGDHLAEGKSTMECHTVGCEAAVREEGEGMTGYVAAEEGHQQEGEDIGYFGHRTGFDLDDLGHIGFDPADFDRTDPGQAGSVRIGFDHADYHIGPDQVGSGHAVG